MTGETCREIAKQTAGISLEDTDIKQQLETLVLSWGRLSQYVLRTGAGPLRSSIDLPSSPPASAIGRPSAPCDSQVAGASGLEGIAAVSISSKRAKARAKAKGRAKENVQSHAQIVKNFRETLASTVSSRNWQMLASSLPSILESTNISNCQKSENDGANSSDRLDPVRALYNIHSIVAPLVLHDLKHLDCLSQLTCVLKENTDQTDSVLPSAVPIAFTASVVNAVGIDKGCQNELQVNLLMTYCFLSAALLHHLKAIGGIKHHTEESRNTDNR